MMTVGRGKKGIWDGKEGDSRRGKEGYAEESEGGGGDVRRKYSSEPQVHWRLENR